MVSFCRENNLPVSGEKIELTDRVACFLDMEKVLKTSELLRRGYDVYVGKIGEFEVDPLCRRSPKWTITVLAHICQILPQKHDGKMMQQSCILIG